MKPAFVRGAARITLNTPYFYCRYPAIFIEPWPVVLGVRNNKNVTQTFGIVNIKLPKKRISGSLAAHMAIGPASVTKTFTGVRYHI